jgi:hypothetical protein
LSLCAFVKELDAFGDFIYTDSMAAYIIVDIDIHDPETYEECKKLAPPSIAQYGGKYLTRYLQ